MLKVLNLGTNRALSIQTFQKIFQLSICLKFKNNSFILRESKSLKHDLLFIILSEIIESTEQVKPKARRPIFGKTCQVSGMELTGLVYSDGGQVKKGEKRTRLDCPVRKMVGSKVWMRKWGGKSERAGRETRRSQPSTRGDTLGILSLYSCVLRFVIDPISQKYSYLLVFVLSTLLILFSFF